MLSSVRSSKVDPLCLICTLKHTMRKKEKKEMRWEVFCEALMEAKGILNIANQVTKDFLSLSVFPRKREANENNWHRSPLNISQKQSIYWTYHELIINLGIWRAESCLHALCCSVLPTNFCNTSSANIKHYCSQLCHEEVNMAALLLRHLNDGTKSKSP